MREAHLSVWQWCVRTAGWCRQPPSRSFHWTVSLTIPAEYRWERELIGWKMKWKEKEESGSFKVVRKPPQLNQLCISLVWIIKVWWGKNEVKIHFCKFVNGNLTRDASVMLGDFWDWRVLLAPPSHSMVSLSHHAVRAATSLTVSHCLKKSNPSRYADGCHCPVSAPVDLLEIINHCVMMIRCWILINLKSDSNQRGKTDPTVYNRWQAYDWKYIRACD